MNVTRAQFIAEARTYLGCPWRHQGRTVSGIDCVGLIVAPLITLGILSELDDVRDYKRDPEGRRLVDMLHRFARRLPNARQSQAGDILALKFTTEPQHLVIVTRTTPHGPHILHAAGEGRTVVEHFASQGWFRSRRAQIHGAFSLKCFDDSETDNLEELAASLGCGCP